MCASETTGVELEEEDSVEVVWVGPRKALPKVNLNVFRGAVFLPPLSEYGLFGFVFTIRMLHWPSRTL